MYNHMLRLYGTDLASEQALPSNTSAVGNGGGQSAGGLLGSTEMVMVAATAVSLTVGKTISMTLEDSDDNETFSAVPMTSSCTATSSACSWAIGDVIARLPVPSDAREYVRVKMSTDDTAVSGSVDIVFDYLPR
ncbi:MAG: hypothetical protein R3Y11_02370 [Pseudomonadota bacterium]